MQLKSLTYTSLARLDLTTADLEDIMRTAREVNALDGITGLLVFNGSRFLQIIEGTEQAIDELVERLRRDPRHSGFEIRDQRAIEQRSFPDWAMELCRVNSSRFEARDTVSERLPPQVPDDVRDHVIRMTESISGVVEMPD